MPLLIAWIVFLFECALSVVAGMTLRRFWSQATIDPRVRRRATRIYAIGCVLILLLMFFLPL